MNARKIQLSFCVSLLGLFFYLFAWSHSSVYAWEYCGYNRCASANVNTRICDDNNTTLCKCLKTGERVTDGLGNVTGEYFYVKVTKCSGRCVEDFSKYDEPVCLDQNGEIENIENIQSSVMADLEENPSETVNTGNLGTADSSLCEGGGGTGIQTALGCVPYTTEGFVSWLLQILFGISGGIAFLLMVYGFILMATSSGDEKKVQGAKETITSAITGLLVSIFALFIFRLIAVNILRIPGLG